MKLLLILILIIGLNHINCLFDDTDYYIGAVVEYTPIYKSNISQPAVQYMLENIKEFVSFVDESVNNGAQIIVFPEYGIIGSYFNPTRDGIYDYLEEIPDISSNDSFIIACKNSSFDDRPILQSLSCIALQYSIYLVVDMGDRVSCTIGINGCMDGRFQYNTQVVLSSKGELIAKYHKSHLYFEPYFDVPSIPDVVSFETDFNVTFGMFICFDILFQYPQYPILHTLGIRNLVYSTEWVNSPFSYAREMQEAWSYVNSNNILASNIGSSYFSSGSGIYSSGNVLGSTVNPTLKGSSKLIVSQIPKIPETSGFNSSKIIKGNNQKPISNDKKFSFIEATLNASSIQFYLQPNQVVLLNITNNNFTCNLLIESSSMDSQSYLMQLSSYSGSLLGLLNTQICWVVLCPNNQSNNCLDSTDFKSTNLNITQFELSGNFGESYNIYPMITSTQIVAISDYNESNEPSSIQVSKPINSFIGSSLFGTYWGEI